MAAVNSTSSSQTAYSYLQYKNKIGGLVSGMDIDSLMEKLMKAESAQMEKLQQQKQKYEWKRDAYREVNTSLNTFRTDTWDKFGLSSSWSSKTVTSSSSKVSVQAGSAASGTLNIDRATAAKSATSTNLIGSAVKNSITQQRVNENTKISNIEGLNLSGQELKLTVAGQETVVSVSSNDTLGDLVKRLNSTTLTIDGEEKTAFKASITDGKLSISSSLGTVTSNDSSTLENLNMLGMKNNTTALGKALKVTDVDGKELAITKDTKVSELGLPQSGTLTFNIGDSKKTITYDASDDTIGKLFEKINVTSTGENDPQLKATLNSSGQISITSTAGIVSLEDSSLKESLGFENKVQNSQRLFEKNTDSPVNSVTQGTTLLKELGFSSDGSFTLRSIQNDGSMKDTEIKYNSSDTINSLMSRINSANIGVTAIFNNGQMSITSNNTGAAKDSSGLDIPEVSLLNYNVQEGQQISNAQGLSLFNKLGMISTANANGEVALADGGSSASLTVNGVTYEGSSNTFSIAGYTVQLKEDITSSDNVSISSTSNVDGSIDKVKEFVTMYNDLIKSLNSKTTEKRNVSYEPLTDAQKAEMTDSEISKWEEKAKAGLLKGDTNISNLLTKMRSILNSGTGEETLYNIGISSSKSWSDNGKLEIDETKLRTALEKNPDILGKIFVGTTENPGIVSKIRKEAQTAITNIEKSAGKTTMVENQYTLGRNIMSLDTKINDWKERLKDIEERYWNQFSAMETAIQKANNQSSIFSS
ncbi:flagellar filament capping protein FliD [Kurthia senegalensis]|uniref:flagellar filament capping protein FliD n=1 Tax=Kurthia senegalensis TaxID=1033740 RepID=UPI000288AF63|nr:flagellar filament capping protein FliD [Kurthia senegalensis]